MKPKRNPNKHSLLTILLVFPLCIAILSLAVGCDPKGKRRSTSKRSDRRQAASQHQAVRPKPIPPTSSKTLGVPEVKSDRIRIRSDSPTTKPVATASKPVVIATKPNAKKQASQVRAVKVDTLTLEILKKLRDSWNGSELAKARSDKTPKTPLCVNKQERILR